MVITPTRRAPSPHPRRGPLTANAAFLVAVTAMAPAAWGTTYAVTTEFLPPNQPMFSALMRSLPGGLILVLATGSLPQAAWWWRAATLGALNIGTFFPLLFIAAERLPGGVAATLGAVQPLLVAGLAVGVLREPPSPWRIGWGVAGVAGVGLVVLRPGAQLDALGLLAGVLGAASMALGVILTKHWGRPPGIGPLAFAGWQLAAGGLLLLPVTFLVEGSPARLDGTAMTGYLWLGTVGGFVAYALWFRGIARLPVTATSLLGLLSPLVAALIGVVVLDEVLTPRQLGGFALALAALLAGQLNPGRPLRPTENEGSTVCESP